MLVLNLFLFVLANSSPSLLSFPESYSVNSGAQVSTTVLGPEQKMPDGNLQLCVIDSFLFEIRLKPVTEIYHIVLLVLCFIKYCHHLLSPSQQYHGDLLHSHKGNTDD